MVQIKFHLHGKTYLGNTCTEEQTKEILEGLPELFGEGKLKYIKLDLENGGHLFVPGDAVQYLHVTFEAMPI